MFYTVTVVYEIECECEKKYFGQTSQFLYKRIQQHKNDINKMTAKTGLSNHVIETGHNIKWEEVKIKNQERNIEKRCFLEMSNIIYNTNNMNVQTDYNNCQAIYKNLLSKFK